MYRPRRLLRIDNITDGVQLLVLETSDVSSEYIALSHCWRQHNDATGEAAAIPKTNLLLHESAGLSEQSPTRTFRDAVDVTRKLGIKYIWINSLCIYHDRYSTKYGRKLRLNPLCLRASFMHVSLFGLIDDISSDRLQN